MKQEVKRADGDSGMYNSIGLGMKCTVIPEIERHMKPKVLHRTKLLNCNLLVHWRSLLPLLIFTEGCIKVV